MSISNKHAPADRQSHPDNPDQHLQPRANTATHDARSPHQPQPEPNASHPIQDDAEALSMRPPPLPSSRVFAMPPYASRADASLPVVYTHTPAAQTFPFALHAAEMMHDAERADRPLDRLNVPSAATHTQRTQCAHQYHSDSAAYAHDAHAPPPSSRQSEASRIASSVANTEGAQLHELRTGPTAPPPMLTGLPHHSNQNRTYKLIIRQQPQQGRLCGLGSKDKRPLDPLPILQLRILNEDGTEDEDAENSPNLILQVSLRKEDPASNTHSDSVLVESNDASYPWTRMLEGRLVASANVARDLDGCRACFFVFTDLSIRQEGRFRLAFKLICLGPPSLPSMGASTSAGGQVLAEALTEPFAIYSPRRFPGMTESTELAKCLARQGIQVPVRNDIRRKHEHTDSHTVSADDKDTLD